MPSRLPALLLILSVAQPCLAAEPEKKSFDLVIYGGTSSGVAAAVQARRMNLDVVVIEPTDHVGGLTTNGLGYTDTGDKRGIGGLAREFYQAVKKHYDDESSWKFVKRSGYSRYRPQDDAMWTFEPHLAEQIYQAWIRGHDIQVDFNERLDRKSGVTLSGKRIVSIRMESGRTYAGKMFIDATYEGDLLAAAGVTYAVGREANAKYGEQLNGVQRARNTHKHRFLKNVDPYRTPGDASSGLLPGIRKSLPAEGEGDDGLQAFCYRMCMTRTKANLTPFPKPADYDEARYELLFRNFEAGDLRVPLSIGPLPNDKTDTNNNCAVSTDYIGANHSYPEASYAEREAMLREHKSYQQGLMWSLANHPRVPVSVREQVSRWGLAKDEWVDNGNWPRQIYVREARRMVSDYVMTELDCRRERIVEDPVGLGSYNMDSHNVHRYVTKEGFVQNEGDVQESPGGAYLISYRSIRPKPGETENLLVPVCLSSSHIAFGSIRMEPVFMILGQSAATAAALALEGDGVVQNVSYDALKARLLADKQVISLPEPTPPKILISAKNLPGVVVDDEQAKLIGEWTRSGSVPSYVERGYQHDGNVGQGEKRAIFRAKLKPGAYEVRVAYTAHGNRASNVEVTVRGEDGAKTLTLNQRKQPKINNVFSSLGQFRFATAGEVEISNAGADGYVIVDAVQFLPVD